ncbi:MAG TPA: tetratricopeptide repeat protein [Thermoanaerobaculia bacterium]|nr:tetratricopeptide repeat protein [Thermoanaerobaculia bacterium]
MTGRPRALRAGAPAAAALLAILSAAGCGPSMASPPKENPILADLVDYRTGLSMLREGRADEAIQLLVAARKSSPRDPHVPNALGLALLYKNDYPNAVRAFSDALSLDATFVEARNNRGVAWLQAGRYDDAEADFQAVLDGPPTTEKVNAHYNLGLLYEKRERYRDAEREFSLAIADAPDDIQAFRARGRVRMKLDQSAGALEDVLVVLKTEDKDAVANYQAAICLLGSGRRDLAGKFMQRAAAAAPESEEGRKAKRWLENEPRPPEGNP